MRSSFPRPTGSPTPTWCWPATARRSSLPAARRTASGSPPRQLEAAITPRTRWLILNSPSNPTGATYSARAPARAGRRAAAPSAGDGHDRRHLRAHPLRRQPQPASPGDRARAARPHGDRQRRVQDLCDDGLAHRLRGRAGRHRRGAGHAPVAVDQQRLLGQPGRGSSPR